MTDDRPLTWPDTVLMTRVRDGNHEGVYLRTNRDRPSIVALNQGGHDLTDVDLLDVLDWADRNSELVAELRRKAEG